MRSVWIFVVVAGIVSVAFADDAAEMKSAGLPVDAKELMRHFQKRTTEKGGKVLSPAAIAAAGRILARHDDPDRFTSFWANAVVSKDVAEKEEIVAVIAEHDRRATGRRFLPAMMSSSDAAHASLATYAVARYFEPSYRADAIAANAEAAVRGLLGPDFVDGLRESQAASRETLIQNGVAEADEFKPARLAKAPLLPGMEYLKNRTPTVLQANAMRQAVAELGDADFRVREKAVAQLCSAGEPAIPFLRAVENSDDAEVRLRARLCLKEIDRRQIPDGTLAAIRVIAWNASEANIEPAMRQLIDYAPVVESQEVEDLLLKAIAFLTVRAGGIDALMEAADGADAPASRGSIHWVRGKIGELPVGECLGCDDPSPLVRLRGAQGMVAAEVRDGVDRLIRLIPNVEPNYLREIEDSLLAIGGESAPTVSLTTANRAKARDAWSKWFAKNGGRIDLASLRREQPYQGIVTIGENGLFVNKKLQSSKVWQRGRDGSVRWTIDNFQGVSACDLLRNGNVVVGEQRVRRVVERDPGGADRWQHPVVGNVTKIKRLANGNTFIATTNQFLEVASDQRVVASHSLQGTYVYAADLTDDGKIAAITSHGQLVEFDAATGAASRTIPVKFQLSGLIGLHAYAKNRYLVALPYINQGQVVEYDDKGNVLWKKDFKGVHRVLKLPTGNVLVASSQDRRVAELDREGRIVWEHKCDGVPMSLHAH